jgi:hypothetical protein
MTPPRVAKPVAPTEALPERTIAFVAVMPFAAPRTVEPLKVIVPVPAAEEFARVNCPAVTLVPPEYVLTAFKTSVPVPEEVRIFDPLTIPPSVARPEVTADALPESAIAFVAVMPFAAPSTVDPLKVIVPVPAPEEEPSVSCPEGTVVPLW